MIPATFPPLPMSGGGSFRPADLQGGWTVLYFYPKDATPGCTAEGQDFRDLYPQFAALGVKIYGISRDSLASHEKFVEKQGFPFALISDGGEHLCRAFDVIQEKTNFGKTYLGIVRSTFLINPQGGIAQQWRKVKVAGHAQAVLDAVRAAQA